MIIDYLWRNKMTKIEKEKQTIKLMIDIYCKKKHGNKSGE